MRKTVRIRSSPLGPLIFYFLKKTFLHFTFDQLSEFLLLPNHQQVLELPLFQIKATKKPALSVLGHFHFCPR